MAKQATKTKTKSPNTDKKEAGQPEAVSRLRLRLRAYDHKLIDTSARQIIETVERHGSEFHGPIPLPTQIKKYTVNRSTFVHKNSREQYEMRIHKRVIDIFNPTPKIMDALMNLTMPAGVDIEVKM
jgi:small subunit ribosomal protein S10